MMEALQKLLGQIKVPCANDNVYKEECVYSFDNPVRFGTFLGLEFYLRDFVFSF